MANVKWIKIVTDIFDNRKIKQIENMPEGDAILVIWFKLICLAGSTNDDGFVYLTEEIPFNTETLSIEFGKPLQTIKLALTTFQRFGMIEIIDDFIKLSNWERYQNVEGMEKIREQTRKRVAKHRAKKALEQKEDVTLQVTNGNATDIDIELDIDRDIDRDIDIELDRDIDRDNSSPSASARGVDIDVNNIMDQWNNLDPNITKLQALNPGTTRYRNLKARLNQYGTDSFITVMDNIKASAFLRGYVKEFIITFDWLVKPNNYIKVLEGNYNERATPANRQLSEDEKRRQVIENFLREENKN